MCKGGVSLGSRGLSTSARFSPTCLRPMKKSVIRRVPASYMFPEVKMPSLIVPASAPQMDLVVGFFEIGDRKPRVTLGGHQGSVPEDLLGVPQVGVVLQKGHWGQKPMGDLDADCVVNSKTPLRLRRTKRR